MLTFKQSTGALYDADGKLLVVGYAGGNLGMNPEGINNPEKQAVVKVGPLPRGKYTFGRVVEGSHLGPFAIELIPDASNEMFGRSGFFMHGDSIAHPRCASEGCIVIPRTIREFAVNVDKVGVEVVE